VRHDPSYFGGGAKPLCIAKDLISNLLETDPGRRFTAKQALGHPWIGLVFSFDRKQPLGLFFTMPPAVGVKPATCKGGGGGGVAESSRSVRRSSSVDGDRRRVLKSSMNKAIDAQRDGLLTLKPATESLLAMKRRQEAIHQQT